MPKGRRKHPSSAGITAKPDSPDAKSAFNPFDGGHAFWWPYLSVSKVLLQTHKNALAYSKANRELTIQMQSIARKEHDLMVALSERLVGQMTKKSLSGKIGPVLNAADLDAIYEQARKGVVELGQSWVEAQLRSLEILLEHSKKGHG